MPPRVTQTTDKDVTLGRANRLCYQALTILENGARVPIDQFKDIYDIYQSVMKSQIKVSLKSGNIDRANYVLWSIATKYILCNPNIIAYHIKKAYKIYDELIKLVGRSLEGEQSWNELQFLIALFEEVYWKLLEGQDKANGAVMWNLASSRDFVNHLQEVFDYQAEIYQSPEDVNRLLKRRKEAIYAAIAVYAKCRWIINHEPDDIETVEIDSQEAARQRAERQRRRDQKRKADRDRTKENKGSSAEMDTKIKPTKKKRR